MGKHDATIKKYIRKHKAEHGEAPSVRQHAKHMGVSISVAHRRLRDCEGLELRSVQRWAQAWDEKEDA